MSSEAGQQFNRIADALLAGSGAVDGEYRYVGAVAPALGVPLTQVQQILDKLERLGMIECAATNPLQSRLTKWGQGHLDRQARKRAAQSAEGQS